MSEVVQKTVAATSEPRRRLSPWRVLLAVVLLSAALAGGAMAMRRWQSVQTQVSFRPWFAGYVDVTSTPLFPFEQTNESSPGDAILSFIVSSNTQPCTPTWGGVYTLDKASDALDLDRRIARLKQQGGNVAVSFGGLNNHELAVDCKDPSALKNAYKSVIERYDVNTIDLDLEGPSLTDKTAGERRAKVLAELQTELRASGRTLAIWATLPVTPQGLSEAGTDGVSLLLSNKVDLAGVNIMTMDYGASLPSGQSMRDGSQAALTQTQRQLGVLYKLAGIQLTPESLWAKLGTTPMIGQNDEINEIFTIDDAKGLNAFAREHGVGRMSMWSANRDIACGSNYVDLKIVSDSCSGVKQSRQEFAATLGSGFDGSFALSAAHVTASNATSTVQTPDDPASSPYQIWSAEGAYVEGTKVVWHHNVYKSKWWTEGDEPDSPVLQAWQTPWELVGPVLAGEKPVPQATLPDGTYPNWSGTDMYDTGQRVLFNGVPYQAKWWNQGNSPAAASANADSSPWAPLTQTQIDEAKSKAE